MTGFPKHEFLRLSQSMGFNAASSSLIEILALAPSEQDDHIDVQVLFHIIGEAVAKVRERNLSFWMTVMTVTGSSISWVDFRRKLSKWLSTNGMGIAQSKSIISFVQQNVDPNSTGLVRKDTFLRFADDLMGYDCLLAPETLVRLAHLTSLPSTSRESTTSERASTQVPSVADSPAPSTSLTLIRRKLALNCLEKLFASRTRILFAVYRISPPRVSKIANVREVVHYPVHTEPTPPHRSVNVDSARVVGISVQVPRVRILASAFAFIRSHAIRTIVPADFTDDVQQQEIEDDSPAGPSWTVTIQAVAVSNLFGILRTCLVRVRMPAFFSIKCGHSVDDYHPLREISWAQSDQGKKDAQAAMGTIVRKALQPIKENCDSGYQGKENYIKQKVEYDLSI